MTATQERASRGLSHLSSNELQRELQRRRRVASRLVAKRDRLLRTLARLENEIRAFGGLPVGPARSRPRNEKNLTEALSDLLKGKSMSVTDAASAVREAGYRTNSNNFRTQVNIALIKGPFKRTGRGMYTAK